MQKNQKIGLLVVSVIMLVLLYFRFTDFFQYANSRVVEPWGDGYKAYMAIVNHAKFDSTYSHFEGMNYPYGDHAVPGATQPLVSNTIRFISKHFIDVADYTIGVVNLAMILGLVLCAVFLYLTFIHLRLPVVYSAIVAIGLAFLNPQMARMGSHYGLAHPEVLPIIFYLLLRFEQERHWKWSLGVALTVWTYSLIHFYFFGILAVTVGLYFVVTTLRDKDFSLKVIFANLKHFAIQLLLPLAFFIYWIYWNDPIDDRCSEPWGFLYLHSELSGVFSSLAQPYFKGMGLKKWGIENTAYLGGVAIITGAVLVLLFLKNLLIKAPVNTRSDNDQYVNNLLFTSGLVLLISFGFPFTMDGWEYLLEYLKPAQQFRSVGRFAWAGFYGLNIVAFYWLYQKIGRQKWWLAIPVGLLLFEAWNHSRVYNFSFEEIEEFSEEKAFTNIDSLDFNDYQAQIPIPYYNIGSGNYWIDIKGFVGQKSQTIAMQTGLPLTGAMLTRSSLSQTFKQIQLVTEPYRPVKLLNDLKDDRPFLLVWDATRAREFSPKYDHLKEGLEMVYENYPLQLYRLPLSEFDNKLSQRRDNVVKRFESDTLINLDSLTLGQNLANMPEHLLLSDTVGYLYYNGWEDNSSSKIYQGKGGFETTFGGGAYLLDTAMPKGEYDVSFWMDIHHDLYPRTEFIIEFYNPENGQVKKKLIERVNENTTVIGENGWGLIAFPLEIEEENIHVRVSIKHSKFRYAEKVVHFDELLIRPVDVDVLFKRENWFVENNRWFE